MLELSEEIVNKLLIEDKNKVTEEVEQGAVGGEDEDVENVKDSIEKPKGIK